MDANYYVKVTVKSADGKSSRSYVLDDMTYTNREEARHVAQRAFQSTPNVIQVEVYQDGMPNPVVFFH
jgi:hypothetical protein